MIIHSFNPIERGRAAVWLEHPIREPSQVTRLLRQLREFPHEDGPVDIVIDGGGGNCALGLEMYTALRDFPRQKRVTIFDAPSMSGVIAMAGDVIRIVETGSIFLHDVGYSSDPLLNDLSALHMPARALRSLARKCDATDALHHLIFARKTGLTPSAIADMRARETTLNAHEALRLGFVDRIISTGRPGGDDDQECDDG